MKHSLILPMVVHVAITAFLYTLLTIARAPKVWVWGGVQTGQILGHQLSRASARIYLTNLNGHCSSTRRACCYSKCSQAVRSLYSLRGCLLRGGSYTVTCRSARATSGCAARCSPSIFLLYWVFGWWCCSQGRRPSQCGAERETRCWISIGTQCTCEARSGEQRQSHSDQVFRVQRTRGFATAWDRPQLNSETASGRTNAHAVMNGVGAPPTTPPRRKGELAACPG